MDVSLTPELERRIAEQVEAGLYATPGEVVQAALALFFAAEKSRAQLIAELDREIQIAIDQVDRGEVVSAEEAFADADAIIEAARARS